MSVNHMIEEVQVVSSRVESSENLDASDLNSLPSRAEGNRPSDILHPSNKYIYILRNYLRGPFLNSGTVKYLHTTSASVPPAFLFSHELAAASATIVSSKVTPSVKHFIFIFPLNPGDILTNLRYMICNKREFFASRPIVE